jgi:hypothetical protein
MFCNIASKTKLKIQLVWARILTSLRSSLLFWINVLHIYDEGHVLFLLLPAREHCFLNGLYKKPDAMSASIFLRTACLAPAEMRSSSSLGICGAPTKVVS